MCLFLCALIAPYVAGDIQSWAIVGTTVELLEKDKLGETTSKVEDEVETPLTDKQSALGRAKLSQTVEEQKPLVT